jgi:hypothetical protein
MIASGDVCTMSMKQFGECLVDRMARDLREMQTAMASILSGRESAMPTRVGPSGRGRARARVTDRGVSWDQGVRLRWIGTL